MFPKICNVGKTAHKGTVENNRTNSAKLPAVGIEHRTSCDLLWCLPNCANLTFGQIFKAFKNLCSFEFRNDPSPKSEVTHETKICLKIYYPIHVCLAQSIRHQRRSQVVLGSILLKQFYFAEVFCPS